MIGSNIQAGLALAVLALAQTTEACMTFRANVNTGLGHSINILIVDNGRKICDIKKWYPQRNPGFDCGNGYGVAVDQMGGMSHAMAVHYRTPGGLLHFMSDKPNCNTWNCCGGQVPCMCHSCSYQARNWC